MAEEPLIPPETLEPVRTELRRRIDRLDPPVPANMREGEAGEALAWSLLFEHWPDLLDGEALDPARRLYNRYYWFVRFKTLWQAAHGYDAGLEGQAHQILEYADVELDWDLLQEIDTQAKAEASGPSLGMR